MSYLPTRYQKMGSTLPFPRPPPGAGLAVSADTETFQFSLLPAESELSPALSLSDLYDHITLYCSPALIGEIETRPCLSSPSSSSVSVYVELRI